MGQRGNYVANDADLERSLRMFEIGETFWVAPRENAARFHRAKIDRPPPPYRLR
jgi:hypothetical protein